MDSVLASMECDLVTVSRTVAVPRTIDACDCSLDDESCTEPNVPRGLDPLSFEVNRSSVQLTDTELSVLNRGLSFVPVEHVPKKRRLVSEFNELVRLTRITYRMSDTTDTENEYRRHPFRVRSSWQPPV